VAVAVAVGVTVLVDVAVAVAAGVAVSAGVWVSVGVGVKVEQAPTCTPPVPSPHDACCTMMGAEPSWHVISQLTPSGWLQIRGAVFSHSQQASSAGVGLAPAVGVKVTVGVRVGVGVNSVHDVPPQAAPKMA